MSPQPQTQPIEFRIRIWLLVLIYLLGFTVPWDWVLHLDGRGPNAHTWGLLAINLAKTGAVGINGAFNVVLAAATASAFVGTWFRTWGTAYLGAQTMQAPSLRGAALASDGPYRYVRNPLYLGTMFLTLALAVLMPASGAVFAVVGVALLQMRLISLEENFLPSQLGPAYVEYRARVPGYMPALSPRVTASGKRPHWLKAFVVEIFGWGVAVSFAAAGWRYNAGLLTQCVLVSFGIRIIARAFPLQHSAEQPRD